MGSGPSKKPSQRYWVPAAIAIGVAVVLVSVVVLVLTAPSSSHLPAPLPYPVVNATIGTSSTPPVNLTGSFQGVDFRADNPISSWVSNAINTTGTQLIRWPGGGDGDRLDPLADGGQGLLFSDSGNSTAAETSLSQFAQWCKSFSCHAIITLPGEIDNASMAAAIVRYSEVTLGFRPSYWEIGNEPADWSHFGVNWSAWNVSQNVAPTPEQFAKEVQQYVAAIRTVDSSAPILGLGGVGQGSYQEATWISDVVSLNGPNISGVAIHVYPGRSNSSAQNLSQWFNTLWSTATSLPVRVPSDIAALRAGCPTCSLSLLVDEFGTAPPPAVPVFTGGYRDTYIAAELVQGLGLPVRSLYYWEMQNQYPSAWLNPHGVVQAPLLLYQALHAYFGPIATSSTISSSAGNLYAATAGPTAASIDSLLVVNANASVGVRIPVSATIPTQSGISVWSFNGTSNVSASGSIGGTNSLDWVIPPGSVAMFRDAPAESTGESSAADGTIFGHVLPPNPPSLSPPARNGGVGAIGNELRGSVAAIGIWRESIDLVSVGC